MSLALSQVTFMRAWGLEWNQAEWNRVVSGTEPTLWHIGTSKTIDCAN